jgi:cell division transport system permease protein
MAQFGKASTKRGKPSYFMSILGVTLVLFVLGLIGWLIINAGKLGQHFKENIEVNVYIRENLNPKDSVALAEYVSTKPYVKEYRYITKEMARQIYIADGNKDWGNVLDFNPVPNSINFKLRKEYVNNDSLTAIKADLELQTYVTEVSYQQALVDSLNKNIRKWSLILLAIALLLALIVIVLIDNTIRLAMFSNRFLIKTMQMVGATRGFIARPMNTKAIINGAISCIIAVAAIWLFIVWAENYEPALKAVHDSTALLMLFGGLIVLGIAITLFSTHRSVIKYLRMKLDDLY